MELDDLKEYLKNKQEEGTVGEKTSEGLSLILKNNPRSPIKKMKQSLVFEIVFTVICLLVMVYFIATLRIWAVRIYLAVGAVVFIIFIAPYFGLYKKIDRLSNTVLPVKKNLEEIYGTMTTFVKIYFRFVCWLIPVFSVLAIYLAMYQFKVMDYSQVFKAIQHAHHQWLLLFFVVYIALIIIGFVSFTKWYLKKLYGRYLEELKGVLMDLEG